MLSHFVIGSAPVLDNHLDFNPGAKPLHGKAFAPGLTVEAFDHPVFPGRCGIDQGDFESLTRHPVQNALEMKA